MKKNTYMKYGLYFTQSFITLIDELLKDYYSDSLKREDFLHLFYLLEKHSSENNLIELPRDIRKWFGTYGPNGKQKWKFVELVKICESKSIITSTSYSNYQGNNYCKSYGYTQEFISKLIDKEIEFQFCEISEKTYNIINKNYTLPSDPILLQHYNTISDLDIDLVKAEQFARQYTGERFLRTVREISTIYNKDRIIVKSDIRTGRIFTSFNIMKKELREFCTYKGESLLHIDLKSSQPYLLSSILLKENPDNREVKRFYDLVTQQDLYDWLIEKWGGFEYHSKEESRIFVKKLFFSYLYKDNRGTNSAQLLMQDYFPDVYELIKEKKRNEEIWLTLQKLESDIFINVCNQYVDEGCLSVHDSLYFVEGIRRDIEKSLSERFSLFNLINYTISN